MSGLKEGMQTFMKMAGTNVGRLRFSNFFAINGGFSDALRRFLSELPDFSLLLIARLHLTNPLTNSCTVLTEGVKTFGKEAEGSIQSQDLSIIWVVNRFIPLKVVISKSLTI